MGKLGPGDPAPPFRLPSTAGAEVALEDLRGQRVVLYFYPKDDTPGCTREACGFRDQSAQLAARGAIVLGVSKDGLDAHARFRAKHDLPFALLTDADNAVARAYGAFGEKVLYGKRTTGTIRSTFLIDGEGRIARAWSAVKVDGHADAVLAALAALDGCAQGTDTAAATRAPAAPKGASRKTAKAKSRATKPREA